MLPSKMMPTNSFALFTTGLPLLPPMMSASETKLNGVFRFSFALRSSQRFGRSKGGLVIVLGARADKDRRNW